jgi:hypothetical protein
VGQRVEPELAAEDGRRREQLAAARRETSQALSDHRADAGRDPERGARLAEAPLSVEQPHHLGDEERVALGLGVDRRHELARRPGRRRELDVLGDVVLAQAVQRDLARVRFARELGQGRRQRVAEGRIDVAVGADDQQAAARDLARHEAQQQQRRLVGGVDVVEDDDERL